MVRNWKLWVRPVCAKTLDFETFFAHWLFLMMEYLWPKFQQIWAIFGVERAKKPPKRAHFMAAASPRKHLKILETLEPQMLSWWNLPQLCITMRPLIWKKNGASPIGRRSAWSKNLWKKPKKLIFWLNFLEFSELYLKLFYIWYLALHCITGPNFKAIWHNLGELYQKNHPQAS